MKTTMYLLRHGATNANLARPARLQGRSNPPLASLGVRQAEATRDFLAVRPIDACYTSPLHRAIETAEIVVSPHRLTPQPLEALTECDVGRWEGLDWDTIQRDDFQAYQRYMMNPAAHGYPGGESFADVGRRCTPTLDGLLTRHPGQTIMVVAHHVVNRIYLAGLLGLPPHQARLVSLDNCGISVVVHDGEHTTVATLNAAFHLQGMGACSLEWRQGEKCLSTR